MEKYTRNSKSKNVNWHKYPTKKVRGLYKIKGEGIDEKINIIDFENYDNENYDLYPAYKHKNILTYIRVKSNTLNSIDKGSNVKGVTNDGKSVTITRVSNLDFSFAVGGGVGKKENEIAFRIGNDYIGSLDLGFYNIPLAEDYISYKSFYKLSDAFKELFDFLKTDDGVYLCKENPKSNFTISKYYASNKKDYRGDNEIVDKIVYKISVKEIDTLRNKYRLENGGGVGLRGNQSKIDMNKNGIIDKQDFPLLRASMNGAWRNEHKHVNSTSTKYGKVIQYETRYARKHNPSRKGYKGKGNFEDGGYMDLSKIKANVVNESNPKDTALVPEIDIENVQKLNLDITDNKIKSEADAVRILKQLFDKNSINAYEEVKVLFLDNNNVVIGVYNHSKGGVTGTIVDVEMICALAVKCLAKGVIMCHNHPSGKLVFSDADKTTSLGLKKALNLFTIILLDSIVITNDEYISMSNQGYLERGGAIKYHRGGSLNQHGLEQGDTIIKTIGAFQKVKDKKGNIIYVDLSSGYRDTQPPLPFKVGGDLTFSEKSSAIAKKFEGQAVAPKYQRMYGKRYDKEEAKEVGNKITGKMVAMGMDKKALGGFFGKSAMVSTPKVSLQEKQVMLKSGEWVQVLDHSGDSLMVMDLNKLGTGVKPMRINISQVDTSSFMAGGKVVKSKPTTKKSSKPTKRGGAMQLAKEIRKVGEKWTDAVKRASAQLKK